MADDDLRAASNLVTTLSGYLITAALAVLGAQAVVATFVIDRRENLDAFYIVSGLAMAALIVSIIFGGRGIDEIVVSGAEGDWRISTKRGKFNIQAILVMAGTILLVASAFCGDPKRSAKQRSSFGVGHTHSQALTIGRERQLARLSGESLQNLHGGTRSPRSYSPL